ncbi:MAG: hypothetical protein ABI314_04380 [Gemmatimonadaceae bacterium]
MPTTPVYTDQPGESMGVTRRTGGHQQGAQDHGEGQHGDKTRAEIAKAWDDPGGNATAGGANVSRGDVANERGPQDQSASTRAHSPPAESHLFNGRSDHDEADLNSAKTRQVRDAERHGHIAGDEWSQRSARASAKRKS